MTETPEVVAILLRPSQTRQLPLLGDAMYTPVCYRLKWPHIYFWNFQKAKVKEIYNLAGSTQ